MRNLSSVLEVMLNLVVMKSCSGFINVVFDGLKMEMLVMRNEIEV